jgi:hypothetical protein
MLGLHTNGRGRPKKYGRTARPVTVTLPEDVLARLSAIHGDLGQAIVSLVERRRGSLRTPSVRRAELAKYGSHAVIVVTPVKALKRLPGVQLVPIGNGRALISLEDPHAIPELELNLRDAIARGDIGHEERETLREIAELLSRSRLSSGVSVEGRTIIVLETKRHR